jgi:NADH:ubiquinone oxidoreductase subunit 6 (subunit J)
MAEVFFFLAAIGAIAGAVGTVSLRNPFYAVLALVCHLLALAALFLLLRAEFVAAAQVVVYAGAVMVLYVFVVAYVGGQDQPLAGSSSGGLRIVSALFAGALFVELCIAVLGSGLSALGSEGAGIQGATGDAADSGFGTAAEMGRLFLTKFLVAFEAASLLLLIAAVGAVILARRRSGLEDPREISVADVLRGDAGTRIDAPRGTMIEAGGEPHR